MSLRWARAGPYVGVAGGGSPESGPRPGSPPIRHSKENPMGIVRTIHGDVDPSTLGVVNAHDHLIRIGAGEVPMTFLGFLVAMLTYQLCGTYNHRYKNKF